MLKLHFTSVIFYFNLIFGELLMAVSDSVCGSAGFGISQWVQLESADRCRPEVSPCH